MNYLRSLPNPPEMIKYIFKTVLMALNEKYTNWKDASKKYLGDLNKFIEKLIGKIDLIKKEGA